jgi:hypothetical protein
MSQVVEKRQTRRSWIMLAGLLLCIVLIGLLLRGSWRAVTRFLATARTRNEIARTRNEIAQLGIALNTFKTGFGFCPPSRIKLCRNLKEYDLANTLDRDSVQFLTRLFPRIDSAADHDWGGSVGRLFLVLQEPQRL